MKIIYHQPLPIDFNATSASGIRPIRMINAFKSLGYEVIVVAGYGEERRKAIKIIESSLLEGEKYDFCYSESSTQPTLLTESHHLPIYPTLDFSFFSKLKEYNVPIGLFYRDIYWVFEKNYCSLNGLKSILAKFFYKYDLLMYPKFLDILYLPSLKMLPYMPIKFKGKIIKLPPGHDGSNLSAPVKNKEKKSLNLLYIGGMSDFYRMHKLFSALPIEGISLTVCTRKAEWESVSKTYPDIENSNITIVHKSGVELFELYSASDVALLFVEPDEYWAFSEPFKLYEYMGNSKPVIASAGTLAAEFIEKNSIGWVVEYKSENLKQLLLNLLVNRLDIIDKQNNIQIISGNHTWVARARQVSEDLSQIRI